VYCRVIISLLLKTSSVEMFGKMANMGPKSKIAQVQTLLTTDIEDEFKHFSTMNDDRYCTLASLGVANNFAVFL
jgi:hypothetical protein